VKKKPAPPWLVIAVGVFAICAGVFDWDFMQISYRSRVLERVIGRPAFRVIYSVLGLLCIVAGFLPGSEKDEKKD
jgi:uncharacterized membrane protein